jgi:NAD(P)-dependent dehydrogenase (short-subunit alcohol dehydrogenase family)
MKIEPANKTVFITGGSRGIGKASAELLASCGANAAIMARGREELALTAATIDARQGGRALALVGDVSDYHDIGRKAMGIDLDGVACAMMFEVDDMLRSGE